MADKKATPKEQLTGIIGLIVIIVIVVLAAKSCKSCKTKNPSKTTPAEITTTQPKNNTDEKQDPKSNANASTTPGAKADASTTPEPEPVFNPADYATDITYEDLARYPDEHRLKAVALTGEVAQVMKTDDGLTQCRIAVNGDYDKMIFVEFEAKATEGKGRILENDTIKVYGKSMGLIQYKSVIGQNIEIPALLGKAFELVQQQQ